MITFLCRSSKPFCAWKFQWCKVNKKHVHMLLWQARSLFISILGSTISHDSKLWIIFIYLIRKNLYFSLWFRQVLCFSQIFWEYYSSNPFSKVSSFEFYFFSSFICEEGLLVRVTLGFSLIIFSFLPC